MGCLSSKIARRSKSFREELISQSLQRRVNGFPVLEEIIISSPKTVAGDDLLAHLVSTANTVAKKLQNGTSSSSSSSNCTPQYSHSQQDDLDPLINAKELMGDLEEQRGSKAQQHDECYHKEGAGENGGGVVAFGSSSRRIRTVEEYDALLVEAASINRLSPVEEDINNIGFSSPRNANELQQGLEILLESSAAKQDFGIGDEEGKVVEASAIDIINDREEKIPAEAEKSTGSSDHHEKGYRRKLRGRELGNLSIDLPMPSLATTHTLSTTGDYVTPRFGSFTATNVFDPELLSSLEEAMKQMTEEEESILQQIVESSEAVEQMTEEEESILSQIVESSEEN